MSTETGDGKSKGSSDPSVHGKRLSLRLVAAESRLRVLARINGHPYDPDDIYQDEGGSG